MGGFMMRRQGGSRGGGGVRTKAQGGEREYYRAMIMTRKGQAPHNLEDQLDRLLGRITHETLRCRYDIRPVEGGYTLPRSSESSELEHPDMLFRFYGEKRFPWHWMPRRKGARQRQ